MSKKLIKKTKKEKPKKVDGFGPDEVRKIRAAIRKVWSWSHAKKLVISRCTDKEGYPRCEKCRKRCPKIFVDHIVKVGDVDEGFLKRLFVPSNQMQGLCKPCHSLKTKLERLEEYF